MPACKYRVWHDHDHGLWLCFSIGDKPWDEQGMYRGDHGGGEGVLPHAHRGEEQVLLGRPIEENEVVNQLQCEEGEGPQLEGLLQTPLPPTRGVLP